LTPKKQKKNTNTNKLQFWLSNKSICVFLIVFVFVLYGKSLFNTYALDDELVVYNNKTIEKGFKAIPEIITSFYAQNEKMQYGYRPVVQITFAVEYGIFGLNPFISHLINVLLYALLSLLLFFLLKKVFTNYNILFPFITTLLFISHPLHTEVVCSLKNRDELLSFLGGISAVYMLIKFSENKKIIYFISAQLFLWLGFFSKLSALTFLGIIPLSLYFFTDISLKKNIIISSTTSFFLLLLFYLSRLMLPEAIQPFSITENPLFIDNSWAMRIGLGFTSLLFYLKMFVFPHPLLFFYGYNMFPVKGLGDIEVWLSMIIHILILGWAIFKIKNKHPLSFAVFFYFISISMFANIATPVAGIVAERMAFAALLSFCLLIAYGLMWWQKTLYQNHSTNPVLSSKVVAVLFILLTMYSIKTISRNADWYNHKTLFTADITHLTASAKANSLLAGTLFKEAIDDLAVSRNAAKNKFKVDSALFYYQQSVDVYPYYSPSWNNMGSIYFVFYQNYKKAIPYFEKAIASDTNYVEPYFNMGYAYELTGDTATAIIYYEKTLLKDSSYIKALSNLSKIYEARQQEELFFRLNEQIIQNQPHSDVPYINISNHYLVKGDTIKAIEYMELAFEKAPQNKGLIQNLIIYYESKGIKAKVDFYKSKL